MKLSFGLFVGAILGTTVAQEMMDIPSTAVDAGDFETLVAALTAADLVGALSEPGPFTVFAPTDDAFDALPEGLVGCLIENTDVLSSILLFHVVSGDVYSTDLSQGLNATTLSEGTLTFDLTDGATVNGVSISGVDVNATNGVIHVIDNVLVPPGLDVAGFLATCLGDESTPEPTEPVPETLPEDDIPTTAIAAGTFETLVTALTAADLVGALSAPEGPFTVMAPSDDAFAALPDGLVTCLIKPENVEVLSSILLFHVIGGEVMAGDLSQGLEATTLSEGTWTFDLTDGAKVNGVSIVATDIETSNGVIHVVENVLVPPGIDVTAFLATCTEEPMTPTEEPMTPPTMDIPATAIAAGSFKTLVAALGAAELVGAVSEPNGPFTVFAPTDDAFDALPNGLVECLLEPENQAALQAILLYHVVSGEVKAEALSTGLTATTLSEGTLTFDVDAEPMVNDAMIIDTDIMTTNGVVHVISSVLVPGDIDVAAFLDTCTMAPEPTPTMSDPAPEPSPTFEAADDSDDSSSSTKSFAAVALVAAAAFLF